LFGDATLVSRDMTFSFAVVALVTLGALPMFLRLAQDAGAEVSGNRVGEEPTRAAAE